MWRGCVKRFVRVEQDCDRPFIASTQVDCTHDRLPALRHDRRPPPVRECADSRGKHVTCLLVSVANNTSPLAKRVHRSALCAAPMTRGTSRVRVGTQRYALHIFRIAVLDCLRALCGGAFDESLKARFTASHVQSRTSRAFSACLQADQITRGDAPG